MIGILFFVIAICVSIYSDISLKRERIENRDLAISNGSHIYCDKKGWMWYDNIPVWKHIDAKSKHEVLCHRFNRHYIIYDYTLAKLEEYYINNEIYRQEWINVRKEAQSNSLYYFIFYGYRFERDSCRAFTLCKVNRIIDSLECEFKIIYFDEQNISRPITDKEYQALGGEISSEEIIKSLGAFKFNKDIIDAFNRRNDLNDVTTKYVQGKKVL